MFRSLPVLITLGLLSTFSSVYSQSSECIDADPTYRQFKSIIDYQGNKVPFDPRQSNSKGNYVKFDDGVIIDPLQKNTFVTSDSEHIRKLLLNTHQVHIIEDGAFLSLNCVKVLDLSNNYIETISKNTFEGLYHLHTLDVSQNNITEIPERVFTFVWLLQQLNISRNHLRVLHPESFNGLKLLEELDLSYNHLHKITPDALQYFDKLTNLQIGSNEIEYLDVEKWSNLTSLKVLNVSDNGLKSVDFLYHYSFSSSLTELYLNDNDLTKINAVALRKHLPFLQIINISKNPWMCADLTWTLSVLIDSRINYNGSEKTTPNFFGIACNHSVEEYTKKWEKPTVTTTTTTTTIRPMAEPTTEKPISASSQILDSIQSLHTIVICLLVIVVIFIAVDVFGRCGWLNVMKRRSRSPVLDDANVEDISLLRGRF